MELSKPNIKELRKKLDVEGLIEALEYHDYIVQKAAVRALREMGDSRAVGPFLKLLDRCKYDHIMQADIIKVLGEIGDPLAVDTLIDALQHSEDGLARVEATMALGKIGDKRAVEPLIKALTHALRFDPVLADTFGLGAYTGRPRDLLISETVTLRMAAAHALGLIGDPRAIEVLKEALNDETLVKGEPVVHKAAKEALERIQKKEERR